MPKTKPLTPEERHFFTLVHRAVLTNPFSEERADIDLKIAGLYPDTPAGKRIQRVIGEVRERVCRLETDGRADVRRFEGQDREIIRNAFLFDFFHQYLERFDRLIEDQVRAGDQPIAVPFAREALAWFSQRGFDPETSRRFFALSYQLRRAYYFIDRGLVGRSAGMRALKCSLWNNVFTASIDLYNDYLWNRMEDFSTLVLGETGTGKGTAAMAIGRSGYIPFDGNRRRFSESFMRSFVSLNLSQYPEALIESELFGHRKGAFTGAVEDHEGIFARCSPCGAIFLDEIGEVAAPVQIKLLKVLEEREFSPVGSHQTQRFEGRVIAATNRPIDEIRGKQRLRDDFFFRLCSDLIVVPPLRQRLAESPGELDDLLAHVIGRILGRPSPDLVTQVGNVIRTELGRDYTWPGNVRELGQCVRRILLNQRYRTDAGAAAAGPAAPSPLAARMDRGDIDAQGLVKGYCHLLHQRFGNYGEVARRTRLDRRTVKKYVQEWEDRDRE